jgi:hypothetical protein
LLSGRIQRQRRAPRKVAWPPAPNPKTAVTNITWWADNFIEVNKRFKEWLLT